LTDPAALVQKVHSLLEDIFEESDGFPANPPLEVVNHSRYFRGLSASGEHPLLSPETVDKLVKNFSRLHRSKRSRQSKVEELQLDTELLGRLLRILERSMRDAQDLNPFPDNGRRTIIESTSPVKGGKGKKGKKAASNGPEPSPELEVSEEEKGTGERVLSAMSNAAAAALCCLVILRIPGIPKELYSEDLLTQAVTTVRAQMTTVLFPVIEGLAGESTSKIHSLADTPEIRSNFLAWLVTDEAATAAKAKAKRHTASFSNGSIASIAHFTSAAVPHITGLINKPSVTFGDQLIINAVFLAIGPIFVHEPSTARRGKAKTSGTATWALMKTLRTDALGCLRVVFAKYDNQRQWILEEVIGQLSKSVDAGVTNTPYQLADGGSINILSALFLQLCQAYSYGVGPAIRKLRSRNIDLETGEPQNPQAIAEEVSLEPCRGVADLEESRMCHGAIESMGGHMKFVVDILVRKSIATKTTRGEKETDFATILTALVSDLLTVIYRPEWPAAAFFLSILLKTLVGR
jgi:cohesin loading factor subunit SCC2